MKTETLQAEYKRLWNKEPAAAYKNNHSWLQKKIEQKEGEAEEQTRKTDKTRIILMDQNEKKLVGRPDFSQYKNKRQAHITEKGKFVRTYSTEVHGQDFWKHAESYCMREDTEANFE